MRADPADDPAILEPSVGVASGAPGLARDAGLAAIAAEFGLPAADLEPELAAAVARGAETLARRRALLAA
ncbi:MAG: hypothetical protein ABSG83_12910 [Roseiarcus sp.]|jgi:hypothetical protein